MPLNMKSTLQITKVKDGWIKRDASSGRFVEAGSAAGISKHSKQSQSAIQEVSARRKDALKRLADR